MTNMRQTSNPYVLNEYIVHTYIYHAVMIKSQRTSTYCEWSAGIRINQSQRTTGDKPPSINQSGGEWQLHPYCTHMVFSCCHNVPYLQAGMQLSTWHVLTDISWHIELAALKLLNKINHVSIICQIKYINDLYTSTYTQNARHNSTHCPTTLQIDFISIFPHFHHVYDSL
jgi:hypothetical protein